MNPGMSYFNRFVAEENDQFEVYAFYRIFDDTIETALRNGVSIIEIAVQKYAEQSKRDKTDKNTVHFIWTGQFYGCNVILKTIYDKMATFGLKRGVVSFLHKQPYHCVTKEKYEELYKFGGHIDRWKMKMSFGDDLEDFLERIKNNEIHDHEVGQTDHWINTYHLSLLSPEEERKLATNDVDYRNTFFFSHPDHRHPGHPDVPKEEMIKSKSKSKYSFSLCGRKTYIISSNIRFPRQRLPDLPQFWYHRVRTIAAIETTKNSNGCSLQ